MTEIEVFRSSEFELRVTPVGDSFRVEAPGLARALGFRDAARLVETIPDDEKGYTTAGTPGGEQRIWYLTEPGFYRAIGQRQAARVKDDTIREKVERFQSWVYRDVLPAIRRTGRYETPGAADRPMTELEMATRYVAALQREEALKAELETAAPKARSWDVLADSSGDFSVADAAKILSRDPAIRLGQGRLFAVLYERGWTFRQQSDNRWRANQKVAVDTGRLSELPQTYTNPDTGETAFAAPQIRVTVKGLHELHRRLGGTALLQVQPELEEVR